MKKLIVSAFLVIFIFATSFVISYAVADDPSTGNGFTVVGTPHFVAYSGEVDSASALAAILAELTSPDQALDYGSVYNTSSWSVFMPNYVVNIKYNAANDCYGIFLSNQQYSGWLHTGNKRSGRFMVHCPADKFEPDLLYSISRSSSSISSKLTSVGDSLSTLISGVSSLGTKLDNLTSAVSAGSSRLNSIYNFLDSDLSLYLSSIDSAALGSQSILAQISSKLDTIAANVYTSTGGSSSALPDEYRRLSYIESNGNQYINTSLYLDFSNSYQFDCDLEFTNFSYSQVFFGEYFDSYPYLFSFFISPGESRFGYGYATSVFNCYSSFPASRHKVVSFFAPGEQSLSVDGVVRVSSSLTATRSVPVSCYLFAQNHNGVPFEFCHVRCYGFSIRQNGAVIRNYIPVLRYSDNIAGLYDLVSGEFFPSMKQHFIAGPILSSWTYDLMSRISSRLDSIDSKLNSVTAFFPRFSPVWCTDGSYSSGNVSDVGYHSLSSLLSLALTDGDNFEVYDGRRRLYLDSLYSMDLVEETVSGHTGYFLRAFGRFHYSENAVNQYYTSYLYLGMKGSGGGAELFFADSRDGTDISGVITRLDSIIDKLGTSSGSDLTTLESTAASIESTLSIINDKLDSTATKIENTTVNITSNNSAYNVFYVTDEDGNEHSITSVAGDSLSAGGKLLNFLYKLVVDGALSGVDGAVDGLGDFFFDSSPSGLGEGVSVWD